MVNVTLDSVGFRGGAGLGESLRQVRAVREGLPIEAVERAIGSGQVSAVELDRLGISSNRQATNNGKLTSEQSDRLLRILRVVREAEQTFANAEKARLWLRRRTHALGDQCPLELLDTDVGARNVEALLGRIAHGIAA